MPAMIFTHFKESKKKKKLISVFWVIITKTHTYKIYGINFKKSAKGVLWYKITMISAADPLMPECIKK